ncbi:MAG: TIGR01777 family protein [Legionella sp.]|nr:TIGR01777 family protein [Legionella sp.]
MNILIAGASGFIGHELVNTLHVNHKVTVLGRNKQSLFQQFSKIAACHDWGELHTLNANDYDAIINLCGENIANSRWSDTVKKNLIVSRVETSEKLINWCISQNAKPHFICANAIGIYGVQASDDTTSLDENTQINANNPPDFLTEICVKWQEALKPAIDYGMPVTTTRFGVVLKKQQGMLKKLFPSFFVGLGSLVGDGKQCLSWVHVDDVVGGLIFLLKHPELTGPFNITSPNPVSQATFARALAKAMHRPLFLTMPAFLVKLLFGEMGDYLLLKGQRVLPTRLLEAGYTFSHPDLCEALEYDFHQA